MQQIVNARKTFVVLAACLLATAIAAPAQTFTVLTNFNGTDGEGPAFVTLAQGTDGNLYGTTLSGGTYFFGTAFKMAPSGAVTTLYSFCAQAGCTDGSDPIGGVTLGSDGNFYGVTSLGGVYRGSPCFPSGCGTLFKITPAGAFTSLYSFCSRTSCSDGAYPSTLTQGREGDFYGVTLQGGTSNSCKYGCGTVFKITPAGSLTTLHSFDSREGSAPKAGLTLATDGNFYGVTTGGGGTGYYGTAFKVTPAGVLTVLHRFNTTDGSYPYGTLLQGSDGSLYGTTDLGGVYGYGTVFKMSLTGAFGTLHSFDYSDGASPVMALVQGTDGNFYGTTSGGGEKGSGTIFEITSGGALTTLHSFYFPTDGNDPGGLMQFTSGVFYGNAEDGGADQDGTIFTLDTALGPFVTTMPAAGKAGLAVRILGTNLSGATSVTFNGTAAAFKVLSSSLISTTVPAGATSGPVQVVTPSGALTSNLNFRVEP
jgi:uncharacterized repeat protein (TIGR03803 family)